MLTEKQEKFIAKMQKEFPQFADAVQSLDLKELEQKLLSYAKHREEVKEALESDVEITRLKEELKELQAPYKDALKEIKQKSKFIHLMMKSKGQPVE